MKKLIGIALVLALAAMLVPSAVFAGDPTELNMSWSGAGNVSTTFTAGNDAIHSFATFGLNGISGTFNAKDLNDNPYTYNVDSTNSYLTSHVIDGWTLYQVDRTDSKTSYCQPGQLSYSYIQAYGGWAEMAMGSQTNYAKMTNDTYTPGGAPPNTTSGKNFEANATSYILQQWIGAGGTPSTPTSNCAGFTAQGNGTALIDTMCSEAGGGVRFGWGCGCYTNADAVMTGSGTFSAGGTGSNSVTTPSSGGWTVNGNGTFGSASLGILATFLNGASVSDYSIAVQ